MWEIAVVGATLSGNKGAAAMLHSVLDNLPAELGEVHFRVLSVYPDEDRQLNSAPNIEIVSARPISLILAVPLAALCAGLERLRLSSTFLRRQGVIAALHSCDLLVDLEGISFCDGRTVELFYNISCVLPALILGKKVVKYSQAMGPFESRLNRWSARALLPRMALNIARGQRTLRNLEELGLTNIVLGADAAFAMREGMTVETIQALHSLNHFGDRKIVGISASTVAEKYCRKKGIDYCQVLADFVDRATLHGYGVWLISHAVRESKKGGRTNDLDTCQTIYHRLSDQHHCELLTQDYSPTTLRAIIGNCDYFLASRFHAMVSSLVKGVPTLVVGWSHKYLEVLEMFDLGEWIIDHQELSTDTLWNRFQSLVASEDQVRHKIGQYLPDVIHSSQQGAVLTAAFLPG